MTQSMSECGCTCPACQVPGHQHSNYRHGNVPKAPVGVVLRSMYPGGPLVHLGSGRTGGWYGHPAEGEPPHGSYRPAERVRLDADRWGWLVPVLFVGAMIALGTLISSVPALRELQYWMGLR